MAQSIIIVGMWKKSQLVSHSKLNTHHAKTRFLDQTGHWYILDNAAVIMPAVSNREDTFLFRLSATLDHPIDYHIMADALAAVSRRFPYFMVELKRGFFWYYFQPLHEIPRLEPDPAWPCMDFSVHRKKQFPFRIRLKGERIACEFSHALTDATGAMTFLKSILTEYFKHKGIECSGAPDIFMPDSPVHPEESEDAYQRYYKKGTPTPAPLPRAYHLDSPRLKNRMYRITAAAIPLAGLLKAAKDRNASMTELLVACLLEAYLGFWSDSSHKSRKRAGKNIAIEVPVNMRKFYKTLSLRNFSLYVMVCLDARLGSWTFDELVTYVRNVMRVENDERIIARQISRNAGGTRIIAVRLVPLFIKDFFAKLFFRTLGQSIITSFISNLGAVSLPPEIAGRVRRFDFIPAPSNDTRTNASVLSWQDTVYLNFGSRVRTREIERRVFSRIASLGVPVKLDPVQED